MKRNLAGTYVAVEPFHLFRYLDEQMFRFNNRATKDNPLNDSDRFAMALSQIVGKRLTYSELTGKDSQREVFRPWSPKARSEAEADLGFRFPVLCGSASMRR